ncbi:hypothetical protein HAX54_042416, partial [Datura stramonium]|nr:hypothetical protein [Datura stramonium]
KILKKLGWFQSVTWVKNHGNLTHKTQRSIEFTITNEPDAGAEIPHPSGIDKQESLSTQATISNESGSTTRQEGSLTK